MSPYNLVNEKKNNNNKIDFKEQFLQNENNNTQNIISNKKMFNNNNNLQKCNFSLYVLGNNPNKMSGSENLSEQTFGLLNSKEFYNKYNLLESKYNALLIQNKKLEENYEELKNSNKSVLDLLTYWQKFYLEILEIVKPKNTNKNDTSINDYMDDPYRLQVINDVKKIVLISRDKVFNNFYITKDIHFTIKGKEKKELNNEKNNLNNNKNIDFNEKNNFCQIESFSYKGKEIINKNNYKKYLSKDDDLNSLPPIRHIEKINTGVNTDIQGENIEKPIIKEVIKEVEIIKKVPIQKFDINKLIVSSKKCNISYIRKKEKEKKIEPKFNVLNIYSSIKLNYKGNPPKSMKKFKKNIMQKMASVQTDMTYKNINSIETLNKACSSQLLNSQREKEKMQKLYEDKITSLNNLLNENIKAIKKEKEKNSKKNKIKEKNNSKEKNKENDLIKNEDMTPLNLNNSFIFLPEMIPPENTYKIFIHCVKHFKYEEDIYKKYLEEEDLYTLKAFVEKMEKYLIGASLPVLKYNKKRKNDKSKEKNINNIKNNIISENSDQKKNKENYIIYNEQKLSKNKFKVSSNSENKFKGNENIINPIYNNNNTFNKYKAAIMALKDN